MICRLERTNKISDIGGQYAGVYEKSVAFCKQLLYNKMLNIAMNLNILRIVAA